MISSLVCPVDDEYFTEVESRTQTSPSKIVPRPHLSSRIHDPFWRIVPGPHCVCAALSAAALSAAALSAAALSAAALSAAA